MLESTVKVVYSAQGNQEGVFKPISLETLENQFPSLTSRMKSLGVLEGKVRKPQRKEVLKSL